MRSAKRISPAIPEDQPGAAGFADEKAIPNCATEMKKIPLSGMAGKCIFLKNLRFADSI